MSDLPRTPREEAFARLALTHALVVGGDAMVTVALAGSIFFSTPDVNGARLKVVLSLLLTMAPFAVVAPLLGPAIDRSRGGRRLLVELSAAGRCAVCVYMAGVVHNLLLFLPAALALLILSKGHAIAKSALVPATVDSPAELVRAGSRLAVVAVVAGLTAGVPAVAILHLLGASWVLRTAAVVYGAGTVAALRTRPAPPALLDAPDHVDEAARSRGVSLAAAAMGTIRATAGFLTFAVAFDFRNPAHRAPAWWYGVVIATAVVGGFVGNVIGPPLRRVLGEERILTIALAGTAGVAVVGAWLDNRGGTALLAMAVGMANGVGQLAFDAILQRDGSEGARGRSFARFEATFQLLWVGGALVPLVVGLPTHLVLGTSTFSLMIAVGVGGSTVSYVLGRRRGAGGGSRRPVAAEGAASSEAAPRPGAQTAVAPPRVDDDEPGVWSAVRPAPGPRFPAPQALPGSPGSSGPRAVPGRAGPSGPRRNPGRRSGGEQ